MKLGVIPPLRESRISEPAELRDLGVMLEDEGVESVWVPEHVALFTGPTTPYPYSATREIDPRFAMPDPVVQLATLAALTTKLQLMTGVLILPLRSTLVLAKQLATLDVLSGGRLHLGVGIGWLRQEFDACLVPFESRAARLEESVAVLRVLWQGQPCTFSGQFHEFKNVVSLPAPHDGRQIPIIVAGGVRASADRAGRIGDGYYPIGLSLAELAQSLRFMREAAVEAGRDPDRIEVTFRTSREPDAVERMTELGVARVILRLRGETLREMASECRSFRSKLDTLEVGP